MTGSRSASQALALAAASLVLGAIAGHAAAVEGGALAMALDGLHLLASGVWAGGLVPLALCLGWARRLPSSAAAVDGRRALLESSGLVAVTILAGDRRRTPPGSRWAECPPCSGPPYGRWLLLKLALFGALLPLAARNLLVWRRRLASTGPGARRRR